MKKIDFGKISVPMDQYASQGNAVLGIRGSGKSYSATYVAERLLDAGVPIVAFDPIGIWRFLRVPGEGHREGYKVVVAGGEHGDSPCWMVRGWYVGKTGALHEEVRSDDLNGAIVECVAKMQAAKL